MKNNFIRGICFSLLLIVTGLSLKAQDDYPVPEKTEKQLFYFQRSHNKNTVVYDLNTLPDGKINVDEPVVFYWIRFEEGGVKKELSFIQKKAFGLDCQLADKKKGSFLCHFKAFKKRNIYLMKIDPAGNYKAYMEINGELSELTRMYIKSENNSLGVPLTVKFVEMTGINLKTRKRVLERFIPKQ